MAKTNGKTATKKVASKKVESQGNGSKAAAWQAFFDQHAKEIGEAFDRLGKKATWGAVTRQFPKLSYHMIGVVLVRLGKVKSKEAALLKKAEAIVVSSQATKSPSKRSLKGLAKAVSTVVEK